MHGMNYSAVMGAAMGSFVVGAVWNSPLMFGNQRMKLLGMNLEAMADAKIPAGKMLCEFGRVLLVAYVLAHFAVFLGIIDWKGGLHLGAGVWIGFQATLLAGAVIWENMPWKLYAIHAGDALAKMLLMGVILGAWR